MIIDWDRAARINNIQLGFLRQMAGLGSHSQISNMFRPSSTDKYLTFLQSQETKYKTNFEYEFIFVSNIIWILFQIIH